MIDNGQYFTINRARQYGKTTTLRSLSGYLKNEYMVISLDFQKMSSLDFENEFEFVNALAREISKELRYIEDMPYEPKARLLEIASKKDNSTKWYLYHTISLLSFV